MAGVACSSRERRSSRHDSSRDRRRGRSASRERARREPPERRREPSRDRPSRREEPSRHDRDRGRDRSRERGPEWQRERDRVSSRHGEDTRRGGEDSSRRRRDDDSRHGRERRRERDADEGREERGGRDRGEDAGRDRENGLKPPDAADGPEEHEAATSPQANGQLSKGSPQLAEETQDRPLPEASAERDIDRVAQKQKQADEAQLLRERALEALNAATAKPASGVRDADIPSPKAGEQQPCPTCKPLPKTLWRSCWGRHRSGCAYCKFHLIMT